MLNQKNTALKKIFETLLIIIAWFAIWQIVSIIVAQPLFMPTPADTFVTLWHLFATSGFWLSVAYTFYRVVLGLVISFAAGILIAFLAARFSALEKFLRPAVAAIKSTPVMSVIMLALIWFSSSFVPVFSCILLCLPIFYANTLSGIKSVDNDLLELASVYRVKRRRVIAEITLPSVMPHIYSAISVCLGFSWKSVVAAEVLSSPKYALGYRLYATKLSLDTTAMFAWTVTIVIISLIVEKGLKRILPKGNTL
jgi:NitT/TauT family transport system permease protein